MSEWTPALQRKQLAMFRIGDRCILTPQSFAHMTRTMRNRVGTVVGFGRTGPWVYVSWSGTKSREAYHIDFLM